MLQVSALHYLAGDQVLEGFGTVASACVLCQPTIAGPSISIVSVHKFGSQMEWSINRDEHRVIIKLQCISNNSEIRVWESE